MSRLYARCLPIVSVRRFSSAWSFGFLIPATTANDLRLRRISIPDFIHYIVVLSLFSRKSQYLPFKCWVLNKGTTDTIFRHWYDAVLDWVLNQGTSRTRSQHSITRLSRRRYFVYIYYVIQTVLVRITVAIFGRNINDVYIPVVSHTVLVITRES